MLIFYDFHTQLLSLFLKVFNLLFESVEFNRIFLPTEILFDFVSKMIIKIFSDIKLFFDNLQLVFKGLIGVFHFYIFFFIATITFCTDNRVSMFKIFRSGLTERKGVTQNGANTKIKSTVNWLINSFSWSIHRFVSSRVCIYIGCTRILRERVIIIWGLLNP